MTFETITQAQIATRAYWVGRISRLNRDFRADSDRVAQELGEEIKSGGLDTLLGHLRFCGAIPEAYGHDTSEEKLYSRYTDIVIHESFRAVGLTSIVLQERADVADVECVTDSYSFVADAKAFRLSRTAKNQKDFKIQALDRWKHGKPYAMVVCPVYQLPSRTSQIYQQAASRSVCIATYSHLAVLANYAHLASRGRAITLLHDIFRAVEAMTPSKSAWSYWQTINRTMLDFDPRLGDTWKTEKNAADESVQIVRDEAVRFLAAERERIMKLSKEEAIQEVLRSSKTDNKIRAIRSVGDNRLLAIG
jgi:type II restriction enzyme